MKFEVYGKQIEIIRESDDRWAVFYLGYEGKKRAADDIQIPIDLKEGELKGYLEDILHEWAIPEHNRVIRIE